MSKTKEMLGDNRGESAMDNRHLDDEYHYQQWCEKIKRHPNQPAIVSNCCEAPVMFFNEDYNNPICTKCHNKCKILE